MSLLGSIMSKILHRKPTEPAGAKSAGSGGQAPRHFEINSPTPELFLSV